MMLFLSYAYSMYIESNNCEPSPRKSLLSTIRWIKLKTLNRVREWGEATFSSEHFPDCCFYKICER